MITKQTVIDESRISSILELEETNNAFLVSTINQINDKLEQIISLEDKNTNADKVLESSDGKDNCNLCLYVKDFVNGTQLLFDHLLGEMQINKEKIKELGFDVSKLKKDKQKIEENKLKIEKEKDSLLLKNSDLRDKAYKDSLTGLYNRYYMNKVINSNINRSINEKKYNFCISLIDLDFFKKVNDEFGHYAGDIVLKNFSNFMLLSLKQLEIPNKIEGRKNGKRNILFRYGGEEFLIISSLGPQKLKIFLDRCSEGFSKIIHKSGKNEFSVTFSGGISEYKSGDKIINDSLELIDRSDKALYNAKENGRNMVVIDTEMN